MGSLISRGRGSTVEVLEHLDKDISEKEDYAESTQLQLKYFVGRLVFLLVLLYVLSVLLLYVCYYPTNTAEALHRLLPVVCFPAIIWLLKRVLTGWYSWKLERNQRCLSTLKKKRKDILDKVKEKETYKHAMEILEKFDPETKLEKEKDKEKQTFDKHKTEDRSPPQDPGLRKRPTNGQGPTGGRDGGPLNVSPPQNPAGPGRPSPMRPPMPPRLARPILPRERTAVDKVVDYLFNDGPNNRFALVCNQCRSHNGMALQEEFEYLAFRCCYCFAFNPARKQRPPRTPSNLETQKPGSLRDLATPTKDKNNDSSEVPDLVDNVHNIGEDDGVDNKENFEASGDNNKKEN